MNLAQEEEQLFYLSAGDTYARSKHPCSGVCMHDLQQLTHHTAGVALLRCEIEEKASPLLEKKRKRVFTAKIVLY